MRGLLTAGMVALVLLTGAVAASAKGESCGTYKSDSKYKRAKIYNVQNATCGAARAVAKGYDRDFDAPGAWSCKLYKGKTRKLFHCKVDEQGAHLYTKGVGKKR
jgi:hypothetical protein